MSKAVFGKLIRDLGTSKQVAIRRETEDIREMVDRREPTKYSKMLSGSKREGFRRIRHRLHVLVKQPPSNQ